MDDLERELSELQDTAAGLNETLDGIAANLDDIKEELQRRRHEADLLHALLSLHAPQCEPTRRPS